MGSGLTPVEVVVVTSPSSSFLIGEKKTTPVGSSSSRYVRLRPRSERRHPGVVWVCSTAGAVESTIALHGGRP
jgi:hypothetical protein